MRLLAGLVILEDLVADTGRHELQMYARDAYRQFRHRFNPTGGLVKPLRALRDGLLNWWRARRGEQTYGERKADPSVGNRPTGVAFVGVWDTVAAYGTPFSELTRAIDEWIWPLSMPNYRMSAKVSRGRHALALDDERETFHPLLWDERQEGDLDRLKQVWFAGMHADVGGGYPDDSLSFVSLDWMCTEAAARDPRSGAPGLRFLPEAVAHIVATRNPCGRLHHSRRGVGGYRDQPRKLRARLSPPDPSTLLLQDPDPSPDATALLRSVVIHDSVFERILRGTDRYAPVGLPGAYRLPSSGPAETDPVSRARDQELVWDWVWHKRVNYFLTVAVSIVLAALPAWQLYRPPAAGIGPQCLISPLIEAAGAFLPAMAQPWIVAFARTPGVFATGILLLVGLLARSDSLQTTIRDNMRALWATSLGMAGPMPAIKPCQKWVRTLRQDRRYQNGFQSLKWIVLPNVFGVAMLFVAVVLAGFAVAVTLVRSGNWMAEASNQECQVAAPEGRFKTSSPCWTLGRQVRAGTRYRVDFAVDPQIEWRDLTIDTNPGGFGASEMTLVGNLFTPIRRSLSGRWFQPMVKIVPPGGGFVILGLDMQRTDTEQPRYVAQFTAPASGALFMFVNDVLLPPWIPRHLFFYENNHGAVVDVRVEPVDP